MDQGQTFLISDWRIDPGTCSISQDDIEVHLEPKVMDLLVYMAKSPGTVHSRDELLDNVWSGVVVSDEALTSAIIKLRKAFNDSARASKVIETVPKRGYRLIARVEISTCQLPPEFSEVGHFDDFSIPAPAPGSTGPSSTSVQRKIPTWLLLVVAAIGILVGINTYHDFKTEQDFGDSDSKSGSKLVLPEKPSIAVMPFLNIGCTPSAPVGQFSLIA